MTDENKIIRGANESRAHAKGEDNGCRVTEVDVLPRLENGGVDFPRISVWVREGFGRGGDIKLLKAIDANARAEERERAAAFIEDKSLYKGCYTALDPLRLAESIRNLGDE